MLIKTVSKNEEFSNQECPICNTKVLSFVSNDLRDNEPIIDDCGHLIFIGFSNTDNTYFDKEKIENQINHSNIAELKKFFNSDEYTCIISSFFSKEDSYNTHLIFRR